MHRAIRRGCAAAAVLLLSCTAFAADPPASKRNGHLVDAGGRALYTFDQDSAGTSTCYAQCAALWPPFLAPAGTVPAGDFTHVVRKDGQRQWAWRDRPLYYWLSDRKPGDATGEAVAGWHLVR